MKVSVCMVTYNHEKYIEQAIASALSQETTFDFEIVVGEDCSTDRTREIVAELQRQHPQRIRLLAQERNVGGQQNFVQTLSACQGQYVACLEGDDFWTSAQKLQRLVDFLDAHPECSMCFHRVQVLYEQDPDRITFLPAEDPAEISSIELLFGLSNPIATCSAMFRNRLFSQFPDWFFGLRLGDWPLHIFNAQHGLIGYLPEAMASYRVHAAGGWSSLRPDQSILNVLEMLQHVNAYLNFKYNAAIDRTMSALIDSLAWYLIQQPAVESSDQGAFDPFALQGPDLVRRLFLRVVHKAAGLNVGKSWLEGQYLNSQAEMKRQADHIARQQDWIAELERAKAWLEGQRANWQAEAERRGDQITQQQDWMERAKGELAEQRADLERLGREYEQGLQSRDTQLATLQSMISHWEQSRWVSIGKRLGVLTSVEAPSSGNVD